MKTIQKVSLILTLCGGFTALAADQPAPTLTELQRTRLELSQSRLVVSYMQSQQAQAALTQKLTEFNAVCDGIVEEAKLPKGTRCNPDTLQFIFPPAPAPEAKVAPKVEEKKK